MPTVTNWSPTQSNPQVHSGIATIDAGQTTTLGIPSNGRAVVQLSFPTGFAGTTVTFLVQIMPNVPFLLDKFYHIDISGVPDVQIDGKCEPAEPGKKS